jgi:glucose/arabinose dehydrogenase
MFAALVLVFLLSTTKGQAQTLKPNRVSLSTGVSFNLNLPADFAISVAAEGLKRVRFMARSPDGRIFVTDMYNLTDNRKGAVYILDEFDGPSRRFKKVIPYLTGLRNPNSIAFWTDELGNHWFYLALTDRLLRYKFSLGEIAPTGQPEVLATFPDYGLGYKYGGWHLTRTIAVGPDAKLYVSVGSSCNACEEKEAVRASILEMDPDGKNQKHFAGGLRNAVGLRWFEGKLYATNMGSDHLGANRPADTLVEVKKGTDYGWPYCYQAGSKLRRDEKFNRRGAKMNCLEVPRAFWAMAAHSSPLGLEFFTIRENPSLGGSVLVALHGSTAKSLKRGYRVARLRNLGPTARPAEEDFINGFLVNGKVFGRPVDIFRTGPDAFLLTDDRAGVVYYVHKK